MQEVKKTGVDRPLWPKTEKIASHGGGTLPYLSGRMDLFFDQRMPLEERKTAEPPL